MSLDRDRVLHMALTIADAEGVDALSMRRLASELAVTPMALYNHVHSRRDLLDGVAELIAGEIRLPSPGLPWAERLRVTLLDTRRVCLEHPPAVPLLQGARTLTAALLAPMETALQALTDAGLRSREARVAWTALISLTLGHVSYQLAGHMRGSEGARGTLDTGAFPRIVEVTGEPPFDWEQAFEYAVDALMRGLLSADDLARAAVS
jgi:TetR/AcrR family transcriptional regulator, tetracycline repressor protein